MSNFKTVSLADQVFEKLESDIISGVYARGEVLTELKLVEQLGVSRTPIREALRRLEQERLIQDSGKGSVVLGITIQDLIDIMEIRQRIEGIAAAYATRKITPEGIEELRRINELQEFYYEKMDMESLRQMDDQFHDAIYRLSGSLVFCDALRPLHKKTQRYRRLSIGDKERLKISVEQHKKIFEAIAAGDAEKAQQLITEHIDTAKQYMVGRFKDEG